VTVLRGICIVAAVGALAAALLIGEPEVFALLWLFAVVLFIVGAGSIAADAVPLRSRLALVCSALTPVAALVIVVAGFVRVVPLLAVLPAVVVTLAPVVAPRLHRPQM
jgi:hypothetical protein